MSEVTKQRKRRTTEERVAEIDAKIAYHEAHLKTLQQKREDVLNPVRKARKASMKQVTDRLKESGLSPEQLLALIEKASKG